MQQRPLRRITAQRPNYCSSAVASSGSARIFAAVHPGPVQLELRSHSDASARTSFRQRHPEVLKPIRRPYHNGWDRAYYDQTAQEETMMAFTAMLSELYDAFRRKVGADEAPAKTAAEAVVIEDARFRCTDGKFDALNHTMDQRFDAVSQRFDVLNQSIDGLSRVMDERFDALNHAMDQRSEVLSRALDLRFGSFGQGMNQHFGSFGQGMAQRLDALGGMIDERFATVDRRFAAMDQDFAAKDALLVRLETKTTKTATEMDAQLARLETKTVTEFRHLRWGLGIVILLVLGLVTKVILAWAMPMMIQRPVAETQ